jgi:hypothetical protein
MSSDTLEFGRRNCVTRDLRSRAQFAIGEMRNFQARSSDLQQ